MSLTKKRLKQELAKINRPGRSFPRSLLMQRKKDRYIRHSLGGYAHGQVSDFDMKQAWSIEENK